MARKKKKISKKDINFTFDKSLEGKRGVYVIGLDMSLRHSGIVIINNKKQVVHQESIIYEENKKTVKKVKQDRHFMTFKINGEMHQRKEEITAPDHSIDTIERIIVVKKRIDFLLKKYKITHAVIEAPSFGSVGQKVQLTELTTPIKIALKTKGIPFYLVPPTTLKYFIAGKGNAEKEDLQKAIHEKYFLVFEDDNESDAFGLAVMGLELGEEISLYIKSGAPEVYQKQKEEKLSNA